jgi:hypothetical protein
MFAYRRYATVQKSKRIVLADLPFRPGQRAEVVVIAEDESPANRVRKLR